MSSEKPSRSREPVCLAASLCAMTQFRDVAGAVLLGGKSSRMGQDKSRVELGGKAAATRLAECLDSFCSEVVLVGGEPPPDAPGRQVADPPGTPSALRGVVGALRAVTQTKVLVVATDYYALKIDLLLALLACPEADAVVPRDEHHRHPLCALYQREPALACASVALSGERLRLDAVLDELDIYHLEGAHLERVDPLGRMLRNINTPEELAALQAEGASGG